MDNDKSKLTPLVAILFILALLSCIGSYIYGYFAYFKDIKNGENIYPDAPTGPTGPSGQNGKDSPPGPTGPTGPSSSQVKANITTFPASSFVLFDNVDNGVYIYAARLTPDFLQTSVPITFYLNKSSAWNLSLIDSENSSNKTPPVARGIITPSIAINYNYIEGNHTRTMEGIGYTYSIVRPTSEVNGSFARLQPEITYLLLYIVNPEGLYYYNENNSIIQTNSSPPKIQSTITGELIYY